MPLDGIAALLERADVSASHGRSDLQAEPRFLEGALSSSLGSSSLSMISIESSTGAAAFPFPFFETDEDRVRFREGRGGGGISLLSSSLSFTSVLSDDLD